MQVASDWQALIILSRAIIFILARASPRADVMHQLTHKHISNVGCYSSRNGGTRCSSPLSWKPGENQVKLTSFWINRYCAHDEKVGAWGCKYKLIVDASRRGTAHVCVGKRRKVQHTLTYLVVTGNHMQLQLVVF